MNKDELHQLIQESLRDILKENQELKNLSSDIPNTSIIGKTWVQLIWNLESLMGEIENFNSTFSGTMKRMGMKEKMAVQSYMAQLQQIVQLLQQLHPAIKIMTDVEKFDRLNEIHPHGRYSQQASATPVQTPQD